MGNDINLFFVPKIYHILSLFPICRVFPSLSRVFPESMSQVPAESFAESESCNIGPYSQDNPKNKEWRWITQGILIRSLSVIVNYSFKQLLRENDYLCKKPQFNPRVASMRIKSKGKRWNKVKLDTQIYC